MVGELQLSREELGESLPFLLREVREKDPKKAAIRVREVLGIPLLGIPDLPLLMEKAGVKLRVRQFGFKKTFGLSASEKDGGPAIVVNSEQGIPVERQLFSVAHELGHLVLHKNSYDASKVDESEEEERTANLFAGHFLVPDEGLEKAWNESRGLHWVESVLRIKKQFKVSYMTVLVRLAQLLAKPDIGALIAQFRKEYAERYGQQLKDHYEPDPSRVPSPKLIPSTWTKRISWRIGLPGWCGRRSRRKSSR